MCHLLEHHTFPVIVTLQIIVLVQTVALTSKNPHNRGLWTLATTILPYTLLFINFIALQIKLHSWVQILDKSNRKKIWMSLYFINAVPVIDSSLDSSFWQGGQKLRYCSLPDLCASFEHVQIGFDQTKCKSFN